MFSGSWIELSRSALANNLAFIRGVLGETTILSSVVKGNAYGHGLGEMVGLLQEAEVDHFSVFNAEEAYTVKKFLSEGGRVMVMGDVEGDALAWAIENEVEFFVFDVPRLQAAIKLAEEIGKPAIVHLEVETGMNRTGISSSHFRTAAGLVRNNAASLQVEGLCTHFAGAESLSNYYRVQTQIRRYRKAVQLANKLEIDPQTLHTCCSAGILRYPRMNQDLARVGILQYGHWPSKELYVEYLHKKKIQEDPLQRILAWKSRVMHVKDVKLGEFIGYGMGYQAQNDMRVGVVPVGYAYGYGRSLSNHGHVLINGKRAPVVGTVNMNAFTVDITGIPEASNGHEVVLIGNSGNDAVSVSSFSEMSKQLNYEILTRLPAKIPRHLVN